MHSRAIETPGIQHYLNVLRRRKWIVLQTAILAPLAAVLFSLHQQSMYRSTAEIWLNSKDYSQTILGVSSFVDPNRLAATSSELARVPTVAAAALKLARVEGRSPGDLLAKSSVNGKTGADLLQFHVDDTVPAIGARLATAYARAFINYRGQLDNVQLRRALAQVNTQIKQLEAIGNTRSALYLTLVQKQQQLQAIEALQTPPILTRPAEGGSKIQPRPVRNGVLALFLGLVAGLALAFLREALDTRVRAAEEIAGRLDMPLLSRLPEPPGRLRNEGKLSMLEEPDSVHAEAFRVLRTNLDFVNIERRAQIIMVTSGLEAEGKSTTVANLAVAFARSGRRVIAVDLDLRRPILDKLFGFGKLPGLTQVAIGRIPVEEALVPIAASGGQRGSMDTDFGSNGNGGDVQGLLELLPAGPIPPDVGEFVGSRVLTEIFEQLRHRADVILVDSPPLLRVGDAITLSGKVDGMLVVTNLAQSRRPMLNELRRVLESCPAEKLGFVVTGAHLEDGYGYGYGGYYYAPRSSEPREREIVS